MSLSNLAQAAGKLVQAALNELAAFGANTPNRKREYAVAEVKA